MHPSHDSPQMTRRRQRSFDRMNRVSRIQNNPVDPVHPVELPLGSFCDSTAKALHSLASGHCPCIMVVMFRFASPQFLWFAPLAALVAWWWARRRRPALRYADVRLFAGLPVGRAWRARWGAAALRGLAALALILACAGPRQPDLQTRLPAEG